MTLAQDHAARISGGRGGSLRRVAVRQLASAAVFCCCFLSQLTTYGAGVTGHVVAGGLVINQVTDRELKSLLQKWDNAYLNGTMFPDAILKAMGDDSDADLTSHGRTQQVSDPPKGVAAYFWNQYWKDCPNGPTTDSCSQNLAFFMGILTHMITDGPWHHQYINVTTDNKCQKRGAPSGVSWQQDGDVNESSTNGRHAVADSDFDFCLSRTLRGKTSDVNAVALGVRPPCPGGTFLDPRNLGECWQCPSDTVRTLYAVTDAKACTDCPGGRCRTTAERNGSTPDLLHSCRSGTFPKVGTTECYSCPSGYQHDGSLGVGTSGVCFRPEQLSAATFVSKASKLDVWSNECSLVKAPKKVRNRLLPLQNGQRVLDNLSAALKEDGHHFSSTAIGGALAALSALYHSQDLPGVAEAAVTPAGPICPWVIEHGLDGSGALNDSASESAKFLDALWSHRSAKREVSVIRIDTFEYAIVKGGKALHQSWHRDCGSNGATCAAPAQCTNRNGKQVCQVLQCPPPDTAANTDIGATIAWTPKGSDTPDKLYFFFKGHPQVGCSPWLRYDVKNDKPDPGYPQSTTKWQTLPAVIDAAFTFQGKAYIFALDSYYKWDLATDSLDDGYPKLISREWPGLQWTSIDAAINLDNTTAYFFKGSQYIKYDLTKDAVAEGYPRDIKSGWSGMPADFTSGISGALVLNGKVYFFKRDKYVRFDIKTDCVDQAADDIAKGWSISLRKSP